MSPTMFEIEEADGTHEGIRVTFLKIAILKIKRLLRRWGWRGGKGGD